MAVRILDSALQGILEENRIREKDRVTEVLVAAGLKSARVIAKLGRDADLDDFLILVRSLVPDLPAATWEQVVEAMQKQVQVAAAVAIEDLILSVSVVVKEMARPNRSEGTTAWGFV